MLKVLKVLPGNRAVISLRGLRRVVDSEGYVLADLETIEHARCFADAYNAVQDRTGGGPRAVVERYPRASTACRRAVK